MKVHFIGARAQERAWQLAWANAQAGTKVQLGRDTTKFVWTVTY